MPLQIRTVNGERVPVVICDHCQQEIAQGGDGTVIWRAIDIAEPRFVHNHCSAGFRTEQTYVHQSMELTAFVDRLSVLAESN